MGEWANRRIAEGEESGFFAHSPIRLFALIRIPAFVDIYVHRDRVGLPFVGTVVRARERRDGRAERGKRMGE
jgi:hypothetical protein